jgi:hypothetical protein
MDWSTGAGPPALIVEAPRQQTQSGGRPVLLDACCCACHTTLNERVHCMRNTVPLLGERHLKARLKKGSSRPYQSNDSLARFDRNASTALPRPQTRAAFSEYPFISTAETLCSSRLPPDSEFEMDSSVRRKSSERARNAIRCLFPLEHRQVGSGSRCFAAHGLVQNLPDQRTRSPGDELRVSRTTSEFRSWPSARSVRSNRPSVHPRPGLHNGR